MEYLAAVARYEDRQRGLGTRFTIEIEDAIQRVVQAPSRWRNIRGESLVLPKVSSRCIQLFLNEVAQRYPDENIVMMIEAAEGSTKAPSLHFQTSYACSFYRPIR